MPYKYPSLRTTLPIAGYMASLDAGAAATDQFTADGSQDGTLVSGATRSGTPLAYLLDGTNDHVTFGDTADFTTGQMTLSMWLKRGSATTAEQIILSKFGRSGGVATEDGWGWRFFNNKIEVFLVLNGATHVWTSTSTYSDTASWHHVAVVLTSNSGTISVYYDGASVAGSWTALTGAVVLDNNAYLLRAGNYLYAGTSYGHFDGLMDDIIIYMTGLDSVNIGHLAAERGAIYAEAAGDFEVGMFGGMSGTMTGGMQ